MIEKHRVTIFFPGANPEGYDLDEFHKDRIRLGRGPFHGDSRFPNDIQVDDAASLVSRAHCTFHLEHDRWYVTDDHSTNGIYFRDEKITSHELRDGDKVYVGKNINQRLVILYSSRPDFSDNDSIRSFSLRHTAKFFIGRSSECNIVIRHPSVSRQHCSISCENGQYYLSDCNSTNGVLLNGVLLSKKEPLHSMDRITIADTSLIYNDGVLYLYVLSGGVCVSANHLCRKVGKKHHEKTITNDVSLNIEPNEFTAIVGGSGAGKTTLLNCLSGITGFTSGEVLINGESVRASGNSIRSLMGYVPQQDIVYDSLTLESMLSYSARLRMPPDTSRKEIEEKIDETLQLVELEEHRKTLISKLSGGQKKRASIAVELLASPKLFFLDEPSSGLDPGTEKHLMQMLKRLSMTGKTIVMVTHTVQNIDMCDRLICMGRGGVLCFSGPPSDAPIFFGKERMTDIYDELNENAEESARKFQEYQRQQSPEDAHNIVSALPLKMRRGLTMRWREFCVMASRYVETLLNTPLRLSLLLLMPVALTILVCAAFQADGNLYNIVAQSWDSIFGKSLSMVRENFPFLVASDTMSLLFAFSCASFWVGIFNSIQEISKERAIYQREKFSGVGNVPYVMSKCLPLSVLCSIQAGVMTAILIFLTSTTATVDGNVESVTAMAYGMNSDGVLLANGMMWLETYLTTFLSILCAMCLGLFISSLVSNEMAMVLCPICLMPQILFSGVVGTLTGLTETLSQFIICKWSCLAYFISARVNDLYLSCKYDMGEWELKTFSDDGGAGLLDACLW